MKREQKEAWYIGRLVRLNRDVTIRSGRTFAAGRVFGVFSVWRGRLSVGPPTPGVLRGPETPEIRRLEFADVDLVAGFAGGRVEACRPLYGGFCRVCGCVDHDGCPPDDAGASCGWADAPDTTLCSRCVEPLLKAGTHSSRRPVPFVSHTLGWSGGKVTGWLAGQAEHVELDRGGSWIWRR